MFQAVNRIRHGDTRAFDLRPQIAHGTPHELSLPDRLPDPGRGMKKDGACNIQKEQSARSFRQCRRLAPILTILGADSMGEPGHSDARDRASRADIHARVDFFSGPCSALLPPTWI